MSQETYTEELTIFAAIEDLERGTDPSAAGPLRERGDETAETLARLYTEVLGLIPAGLEPVASSASGRNRLLAAIGAAPAAEAPPPRPVPVPVPVPVSAPAPVAAPAPAPAAAIGEAPRPMPRIAPGPLPRRQSRWPLAFAAVLALAFAGLSGWLWQLQQAQRAEVAALRQELDAQRQLAIQAGEEGQQARTEMEKMHERFALVTSPSVMVRPLQPAEERQPAARGMLFVAPDHQHWYLAVEGLEPPAEGGVYKLWWMTPGGPHDGGSLIAQSGEKVQMGSDAMPSGITDVVVTLERDPASASPTGPRVLQASL